MIMVLSFGGYIVFQLNRLTRITHLAAGADSEVIQITESLPAAVLLLVGLEKKYWISRDDDFLRLFLKRRDEFLAELDRMTWLVSSAGVRGLLQEVRLRSENYFTEVQNFSGGKDPAPVPAYEMRRDELVELLLLSLQQLNQAGNRERNDKIRLSEEISQVVLRVTIGFAVLCIFSGLVVSLLITRHLVRPIEALQRQTRAIGAGRFVTIEPMRAPPEIVGLTREFNAMSERLKELEMLKEDFISHVSHSLRTPLTAIREASELLIAGIYDQEPETRNQLLAIVRDECGRLIVSVSRILDLSRMESGMMEYRFVKCDLGDAISTAVARLSPLARSRKIDLRFVPGPELPPVLADGEQLQQLLENLIGNAVKFTDPGGTVTLEAAVAGEDDRWLRVSVADTGCGIEPEHLDAIFEKFRRMDRGRNTTRGTGLGLAIAKHIVTAHGGKIWVESRKGRGSTFYFSLPPAY